MALSELERRVLIFEATWRPRPGASNRTAVIRQRFNLSPNQYLAVLDGSCDDPEAMQVTPSVVVRRRASNRTERGVMARQVRRAS